MGLQLHRSPPELNCRHDCSSRTHLAAGGSRSRAAGRPTQLNAIGAPHPPVSISLSSRVTGRGPSPRTLSSALSDALAACVISVQQDTHSPGGRNVFFTKAPLLLMCQCPCAAAKGEVGREGGVENSRARASTSARHSLRVQASLSRCSGAVVN